MARRGDLETAETLAREGVRIAEGMDYLEQKGDALMDLAEVLGSEGRVAEAVSLVSRALDHYEQKEHLVKAKQAGTARRNRSPAVLPADAPGYSLNN